LGGCQNGEKLFPARSNADLAGSAPAAALGFAMLTPFRSEEETISELKPAINAPTPPFPP